MKRVFAFLLAFLIFGAVLSSCGREDLTEEQVIEIVGPLVQKSYEVNDIFFGAGLPHEEDRAEEDDTQYDVAPVRYLTVISDKYNSVSSLKEAALEVYTESYMESVFERIFNGVATENGEIVEYPRYYESLAENLKIRAGVEEESIVAGRKYDVTTLKITSQTDEYVFFTLESFIDGEPEMTVDLSIKDEGNGWRLDSPTY